MRGTGPRPSLGTVLTLCLTAAVVVGCVFLFAKFRSGSPEAQMGAQKVISLVGDALHGVTPAPVPQSTVRTVTVTLAPTPEMTPAPAAPAQTPPAEEQRFSFTLTAGGMAGFHSEISDSVYDASSKTFHYQPILSLLDPKVNDDLNLVTLPHVLNISSNKYADVLAPVSVLDAVRAGGFDDVLINTEHILDQDVQGAADTVSALEAQGLTCGGISVGGAKQNRIVLLNGARIAILAYTEALTAKGKTALSGQSGLLTLFSPEAARRDIEEARAQGANCVIVFLYWGKADAVSITSSQRATAQTLAQLGADVILGARPTRVLPVEMLATTGEDGRMRRTLVAYSLGSLLTESREGYDISGALLHLNITCDTQGRVTFDSVEYTPTYIWRQSVNGKMQYRVVCSSDPPPEGMDARQQEIMGRALTRIQNTFMGCPILQRN